jgi:uncharacterized protein involved in exopolysaccharide biosynthesis
MNQDMRNIEPIDDEISLWELLERLKSGWKWVAGGAATGLAGAIVLAVFIPAQYEVTMVVQPATIGMISATTTTTTTTAVEPVAQTLERLKLVTFYSDEIVKACDADSAKDIAESVKVNLVRNNNLLSITYRAKSATLANACMSKILTQMTQFQTTIAAPLIKELQGQQSSTKQQIEDAERFLAAGEKRVKSSPGSNELSILMVLKVEELTKLQKLYREQRIQLTEPLTQPMKLLEPIYVPEKPVAPKKLVVIASGLTGGMLIGLLAFFANRSWCRHKGAVTLA